MNLIKVIIIVFYTIIVLINQKNAQTNFRTLRREVRYSKFNMNCPNESICSVKDHYFKQYPNQKQVLFSHIILHEKIHELHGKFSVSKCKEYHIDCTNVIAYDVYNICSKLHILGFHMIIGENNDIYSKIRCPLYGEYYTPNISMDTQNFGNSFSFPTEKWWELYWKTSVIFFDENYNEILISSLDFHFLQFRSRGEINYVNVSIDAKTFESNELNFITKRWWEYYWNIIKSSFYNVKYNTFLTTSVDFYVLQYRSRNP